MKHLIDPMDLSVEDIDRLLDRADDIAKNPEKYQEVCKHKKLATLFFEPSTRTRLSFEAAMLELGGSVLGFSSADSSSASKGESVADTARVIECYADIIAMRHNAGGCRARRWPAGTAAGPWSWAWPNARRSAAPHRTRWRPPHASRRR